MDSQFFHPKRESLESMEQAALLALEIAAVITGNFPAALTVMAVHTLLFAYDHRDMAKHVVDTVESGFEHKGPQHH